MNLSLELLRAEAAVTGFRLDMLEKVAHLSHILSVIFANDWLADRLALKGGTALNLFYADLMRLSVDIDLNYIGAADAETMRTERGQLEKGLEALLAREGYTTRRQPRHSFAGGKWSLRYLRAGGGEGNIEIDINYLLRVPLWKPQKRESVTIARLQARNVTVVDPHEVAAGKIVALLTRTAPRDLYDAWWILHRMPLDPVRLRTALSIYAAASPADLTETSGVLPETDEVEVANLLIPVLRKGWQEGAATPMERVRQLRRECMAKLQMVLPFTEVERSFMRDIATKKAIRPELLTDDTALQARILQQSPLLWRLRPKDEAFAKE